MNIPGLRLIKQCVLAAFILIAPGIATADEFSPAQKSEIGKIVREYLLSNPEVLAEVTKELERKREDAKLANQKTTIQNQASVLFSSTRQAEFGNLRGDVTLVEFFDYNCGYCRRALADLTRILEDDKNLKVVIKEFPVLGEASVAAARVSIALAKIAPEKYFEFHLKLLTDRGRVDGAKALQAANALGVDMDKLQETMKSPDINATIEEVYALANGLGLTGTPSYVIGNKVVFGAVGYDELKKTIDSVRNCTSASC